MSTEAPVSIVRAALQLYQLYDVSNSIDLDAARATLSSPSIPMRPVLTRGASIDVPQPPLVVPLDRVEVSVAGVPLTGRLGARIYDLGIIAVHIILSLPTPLTWADATEMLADVQAFYPQEIAALFDKKAESLRQALHPAIERPNTTIRTEDYAILVIEQLESDEPASRLAQHPHLLQAALGETRPLSATAVSLATTLSYYEDDLIVLTWNAAIVIDPDATACEDAAFLLEVANVQLLAFRSYDAEVERDLGQIAPRLMRAPVVRWNGLRATTRFLHDVHSLIVDSTEMSTRIGNALKFTEDVYWNRVYTAALATLRVEVWRSDIAQSLDVLRQTAILLADEAQAARSLVLESLIIILIAIELVVALIGLHK